MKKTLNHIFDEANAGEIENLVKQNAAPEVSADTLSSIKDKVYAKTNLRKERKPNKNVWLRFGAIAACFVLILGAVIVVLQKTNLPYVPTWDTARYSAKDIAKLFGATKYDGVATNAYKKIYVPDSKYLYLGNMTEDEYLKLYRHSRTGKKLNEAELKAFIDAILPKLAESLDTPIPQYSIKEHNYSTGDNTLSAGVDIGSYYLSASQDPQTSSLRFSKLKENRQIVLDGEIIQVDQRLSDEEILDSILSIKNKLFGIFGVSFSDAKVVRSFGPKTMHGAQHVDIYFYDESEHEPKTSRPEPKTDYICISFDNFSNYSGDIVSDSILTVSSVSYFKNRSDLGDTGYDVIANAKRISISEAEALLYHGYVFGGHSCPLCMQAQDKIDFEGYDFVDIEYVFEYSNKKEKPSMGIPFYAFYKKIGTSENGNTIYAKTYVPAIEVRGYKEYFEGQKKNHRSNWGVEEVG